jgi:hypothetical protein
VVLLNAKLLNLRRQPSERACRTGRLALFLVKKRLKDRLGIG